MNSLLFCFLRSRMTSVTMMMFCSVEIQGQLPASNQTDLETIILPELQHLQCEQLKGQSTKQLVQLEVPHKKSPVIKTFYNLPPPTMLLSRLLERQIQV